VDCATDRPKDVIRVSPFNSCPKARDPAALERCLETALLIDAFRQHFMFTINGRGDALSTVKLPEWKTPERLRVLFEESIAFLLATWPSRRRLSNRV